MNRGINNRHTKQVGMRLFALCFLLFGGAEGSGVPWFNPWKTRGREAGGTVLDRPVHRAWKGDFGAAFPSLPAAVGRVDSADLFAARKIKRTAAPNALRGFSRRKGQHGAVYNEADPSLLFGRHVGDAGAMGINAAAHAAAGQG